MANKITSRALRLLEAWKGLQVSYYGGKYSVHRLLALEAFSQSASLLRSLIVCMKIPLPMVVLVFLQESVPLQDPRDGWRANYGFWIRVVILTFVITHFSTGQAVSTIFTLCVIPIGANVIFPLPFSILALTPIYNIPHIVLFHVIMGGRVVQLLRERREQLVKYMNFLYAQILMMFIYRVYEVLFRYAEGSRYHLLVIMILPIMVVLIKNVVFKCTAHVEDITPEAVIFTVDFFNAIYVATCMQRASSVLAILAITVTDLSQTPIMLYGLHGRTVDIIPRVYQAVHAATGSDTAANLLNFLSLLCRDLEKWGKQSLTRVRIRSCFPHQVSSLDAALLDTLSRLDQPIASTVVVPFRKTSLLDLHPT
ncbi:hypothetical protein JG687_00017212 [Phytophthora cactorum]|uniref:Uncharacterized protein n=1 Tax=Phytophthora cactorum TaxID=29920 RepID=A0A8T1TPX1_9STRA|nr:hypothetical protein JG687_00017212 [Phytophthora cactorum]